MLKNKHYGGDGFFRYVSKKAVRPFGFKRIRTSTGVYKSFSRSARGKRFPIFSKLRKHSSKNLKTKLNYMNERIEGKTQKIEGYAVKLKEYQILKQSKIDNLKLQLQSTTDSSSIMKLNSKIANIESKLAKKINTIGKKVTKAQANLTKKLKKYKPKQEKYSRIMQKKIYKSQKRLEKGFTKTCKDLVKVRKSSIVCLQSYSICKKKNPTLDIKRLTDCVNRESDAIGIPIDIKSAEVSDSMLKLANKHFFRRFKRRRHLREINRIFKHGEELEQLRDKSKATIMYGEKLKAQNMFDGQKSFNKLGQLSQERTIYKRLQNNSPGLSLNKLEKQSYEQFDKGEIIHKIRKQYPNITPDQLKERTDKIYKLQNQATQQILLTAPKSITDNSLSRIRQKSKNIVSLETNQLIKADLPYHQVLNLSRA
jgi:hypothetical protein